MKPVITRNQQHLDESVHGCLFFQPGVLGFGLLINGKIGIGVLPESQQIFIPLARGRFVVRPSFSLIARIRYDEPK
jgi:hypothetical protein